MTIDKDLIIYVIDSLKYIKKKKLKKEEIYGLIDTLISFLEAQLK